MRAMRKKTVHKKIAHKITKKTSRKIVSLRTKRNGVRLKTKEFASANPAANVPIAHASFSSIRQIIVWTVIVAAIFGILSVISSYSQPSDNKELSSFQKKLEQVATLSLLNDDDPVTLIATGDILLARYVELRMRQLNDYTYPFQKIADFLKSADITFGNLETPLLPGRNVPKDSMTFRGDLKGVQGLIFAGYDVLSIANNHTMNYQIPGLTSTLQTLKEAGILASGGGKDQDTAYTPVIIEAKGKKIAFYSYIDSSIPPGFHGEAKDGKPGIARMDIEAVKNDVKNALENLGADFVVVSMHAGKEYKWEPTKFQKDFAHAAIDAGASAVIGTHPHVIEPVEYYGNGIIFYSLGNFVFDQFFSEDVQNGLITKITFPEESGEKITAELFPVRIEKGQPRLMEGAEKVAILKKLGL